jgi:nitrogen regulatory protein PII
MAHVLVLVLENLRLCQDVLRAWEEAGAPGVTVLESTGLARLRAALRDDLPLMPSLRDVLSAHEMHHRTLFTVIEDEAVLKRVVEATERVVGDFSEPHTGILFAVPVAFGLGLRKRARGRSEGKA